MKGFYKVRWQKFFEAAKNGTLSTFDEDIKAWEWEWCHSNEPYAATPSGDAVEIAAALHEKYRHSFPDGA